MPNRTSATGSELFIVDNSDEDWKVARYLHDWCQISKSIDIATGYLEIGALLTLKDEWQKVDKIRILMGDEVSKRTKDAFAKGLEQIKERLDNSIEKEKDKNDFLAGVPAIVEAIRAGKIECRVYRKDKFHAKAYITHGRLEVVGASALVGSSNFTYPGLTENIELNVQITGRPVTVLQEWFDEHWKDAEDVSAELLQVVERHVKEYSPFEVYAKALQELLRHHQMTADEWEATDSKVYPILGKYQRDGYHRLLEIAAEYRGAFLCDGVGLGKTFVGLMLIERLVLFERKRVCLLVPKSGRKAVWESSIQRYLPHLESAFSSNNPRILNHTDLQRGPGETDFPKLMGQLKTEAEVFIIDEAHNFRNPGIKGTGTRRQSRYWDLFELLDGKQVYMLTATPVNNSLLDLQHMIELFSRHEADYFFKKNPALGIHSLTGHFRSVERQLFGPAQQQEVLDFVKAEELLSRDALFNALVVQRSRAYVRKSQEQTPGDKAIFPIREQPQVAEYSLKKTYEKILELIENAFSKDKPLFSLAMYYPLFYYTGPETEDRKWEEGRQEQVVALIRTQFLKRFESSVCAFELSCQRLLLKLLAWVTKHTTSTHQKRRLERWINQQGKVIGHVQNRQHELFPIDGDEEEDNLITEDMLENIDELDPGLYKVDEILDETYLDLDQITKFLEELTNFKPAHDDKLKALVRLLKNDPVMKEHKVLIFTEYKDTARYLQRELQKAGIAGVEEIDSGSAGDRIDVIRRFAPYYNEYSSAQLVADGQIESRVLIATDVLSEGLNLQDATRLINYDIHWNPVRLMQRIGRVDRRLTPQTEARILADHPDQGPIREKVAFWNFLPPLELDSLLKLYSRVAHKTLQISKTFGIEGSKLLKPDDDYQALRDFNAAYEGEPNTTESLLLEYQKLGVDNPGLEERLSALPGRVFSGKRHPTPGARAIFFCYAMPAPPPGDPAAPADQWSPQHGRAKWFLYRLDDQQILETPTAIVSAIRSKPDTSRVCTIPPETLSEIRAKVDKHLKNSYLKAAQAPAGVKPVLKAWMELC